MEIWHLFKTTLDQATNQMNQLQADMMMGCKSQDVKVRLMNP
jgi:hypothetical protein